ncbi:MAG: hypothetical protein IPM31_14955 [Anaerolineae bacterium]|nr:hypothetical protein [Anaerolineae bacterium]MBL8106962.1 hypothetical protein [Anaerolineales bacterium]MCC7188063.1 hypothetical protein [Anaerolineales bacterium]
MLVLRGVIGAIILFLGRELNFLFAAGMAALVALRFTPKLPATLPAWSGYAFMAGVAILAAWMVIVNKPVGFYISGFFAGGYALMEWFEPGILTFPILPFFVGSVIGAIIIGVFTDWALIVISSLIGAIYATTLFRLSQTAETLVAGGLFVLGAITQAILMRMEKQ